jgi:hypothetical protein
MDRGEGEVAMTVEEAEGWLARIERERAQMQKMVYWQPPPDRGFLEAQ